MKVELNSGQTGRRPINWKAVGIIMLVLALIAALIVIGVKTYKHTQGSDYEAGYDSPFELADDFVTYTYQGNTEAIFKMQPHAFQERSIEDNQMTYALESDDVAGAVTNLRRPLAAYIEMLNEQHGDWTETHEVSEEMYTYTEEELTDLLQSLKFQDVDEEYLSGITEAGIVDVSVHLVASNGSGGYDHIVKVPVYKHGKWFLGQRVGDVFLAQVEGDYDPYGDLLDGFHVIGEWDADGNRVIRNEEGYQIFVDEKTGRDYFQDVYGNFHYYGEGGYESGIVEESTGPDGGEVLTEETYEAYWSEHAEELGDGEDHEGSDHGHDDYGNVIYYDEDGNVTNITGPDGGEPLTEDNYEAYWDAYYEQYEEEYEQQVEQAEKDYQDSLSNLPDGFEQSE